MSAARWRLHSEGVFGFAVLLAGLSFIANILGPSILWRCPRACPLNAEVIDAPDEPKIASFAPVAAPGIADDPILHSIFFSPAIDADVMIFSQPASLIVEDASGVVEEFISDCHGASDWSALIDFIHDCCFSLERTEFFNSIDLRSFLSPASLGWQAVLALDISCAAETVIMAICLIIGASLISDVIVEDPFIGVSCITSIASAGFIIAGNEHLWGKVDIGPLSTSDDLDPVRKGRGSCECPATTAVNGNMLVSLHSEIVRPTHIPPPKVIRHLLQ